MKKVGIITINDNGNFGNRLQNYAVQQILKKINCKPITIKNNVSLNNYSRNMKYIAKMLKSMYENKKVFKCRNELFYEFNKNIIYTKKVYNKFLNINGDYDYFITGSDQVWNPSYGRFSNFDLLDFAKDEQKISFAASFGIAELSVKEKEKGCKAFNTFKAVSVREDMGKEIVEELTGRKDVEVLIDPTMILEADDWDKVCNKPKQLDSIKSNKYILNYFLGELPEEWKNEINRIAKENNCEIINILDKNSPFYQTGPSEFLYLEKNAFLVCTDSFHSSVFSIIYNTPFVVFDRKQNGVVSMNSRIDTLLSKFALQNRRFYGTITKDLLSCDYSESKKILEQEKEKSFNFLKKALDIK